MHRFYVAPEAWHATTPELAGGEAHHARDVLRLAQGERIVLFNGRGREMTAEVLACEKGSVRLRKLHEAETPPLRCRITLAQAIPKGKNMDLIVQKAVEIGAAEIVPIISDRTIVRLEEEEAVSKQAKWQQIAIEAAKQCGQNWLPRVQQPRKLGALFERGDASAVSGHGPSLQLIASLQPGSRHLKQILAEQAEQGNPPPEAVRILIGPEGDFTPAEISQALSHGCQPISLGPIVLRVETAAIYCLSILSYELL